ncbi:MAG: hypothetical protein ACTSRT_13490 [Promethearchaeota archaeon]
MTFITIASSMTDITTKNNKNAQSIGMTIFTWLAHLAWLLVRAAIYILVWAIIAIFIVGLTIAVASLALMLIPLVLIFSGEIYYKIYEVNAILGGKEFKMGYQLSFDYNSYFKSDFPCLYYYLTFDDNNLIDLLIKLVPPSMEYNLGEIDSAGIESSIIEYSSLEINSLQTSDPSEDISIISPYEQTWISGFFEFEEQGNVVLEFEYSGECSEEDIALKYTIERLDFQKPDIIGYIYPEYTNNGYKFIKTECISEGYFNMKVEAVNISTLEVIESDNPTEKRFRIHDIWSFMTGMFDSFGFFGVTIPIISTLLAFGTTADGVGESIGFLGLSCFFIFLSFLVDTVKPGKEWGEPQISYSQGIFLVSIITGLLFLYQSIIGYGGIADDFMGNAIMWMMYDNVLSSPLANSMIYKILEIFGIFTCIIPYGGFIFDLSMGVKDIIIWMIGLDMASFLMYLRPDVFTPLGTMISFGLIGFGIIGFILTFLDYQNWMDES